MRTVATYFDGRTAESQEGSLEISGTALLFRAGSTELHIDTQQARLIPPVGKGDWTIALPDGASIRIPGGETGNELAAAFGHENFIRKLEGAWHWALLALVVAVVGTWATLTYGVPAGARYVAFSIPPETDARLGAESMEFLDRFMFEPSELPEDSRAHIRELFDAILDDDPDYANYRLEFRASEDIGANAFAVPGGLVIVTDEMVHLIEKDAEIVAVLAHEVGHLAQRHSLRIILQDSASAIIIAGLTGDLSNITALSASIPTVLMQARYSRDFEREADDFSFRYLEGNGMDTAVLSRLLQRLEGQAGGSGRFMAWFESHPRSEERTPD